MPYDESGSLVVRLKENQKSRRTAIMLSIMLIVQFYPALFQNQNPEPFILGLPWWSWTAFGILFVLYMLVVWFLYDLEKQTETIHSEEV